jgi:hypothetical protein
MSKRTITFPSQRGTVVIFHTEDTDRRSVGIYGDPAGLRSLGELLIAEAELDQSQFPPVNLPDGERHHVHLLPGVHIHPQSVELVLGRLDAKRTGELADWLRPARQKRERPLKEILDDVA